jgi:F0F1-type ATP synthase membrane subunit c/vacuolar-type H+-ATPase subunit K
MGQVRSQINYQGKNMNNEPKDPQQKKTTDQISGWLVLGAGIGVSLGIIFDNLAVGISMGAALGLVFGAALSHKNKKE